MATKARHKEISAIFLRQAEEEFEKDDLLQASEKAWGAVAHYLKAVAEVNGWDHFSHYHIRKNADRLLSIADDYGPNVDKLSTIEQLHINFYEERFTRNQVRRGIDNSLTLIGVFEDAEARLTEDAP